MDICALRDAPASRGKLVFFSVRVAELARVGLCHDVYCSLISTKPALICLCEPLLCCCAQFWVGWITREKIGCDEGDVNVMQ